MTNPDHAEAVEWITDADTHGEYRRSRRVPYRRAAMSPHQRGLPTPLPIDIDRIASDVGWFYRRSVTSPIGGCWCRAGSEDVRIGKF
ncbi:hypothetical protein [Nocardia sp. NPDC047648]|uniref:hypothetical protein n=1 Tax=Nocardia sp. NPDC047648 TaxID=3155625 RepID=UPI0033CDCD91